MNGRIVDHLVAHDGLPPRSGLAFDYVLGGDGLFVVAANPWLEVRVPVASCTVRGLQPVYTTCMLPLGRLPASIWEESCAASIWRIPPAARCSPACTTTARPIG
jgi:hypothetical protein